MKYNSRRQLLLLAISIALLGQSSFGQTRRPAGSKPSARVVAKEPIPTFDTLLAADRYKVYSEVRSVGQLLASNSLNDLMNPLMQLSAPPKEFQAITKWLKAHADELMTSRMMVASWSAHPGLPEFVLAIEFSSAEEARKFDLQLKGFLPKVLNPPTPSPSVEPSASSTVKKNQTPETPTAKQTPPPYVIKQVGDLVLVSDKSLSIAQLRPVGSKLLSESQNFRLARDQFSSESLFVYFNVELEDKSYLPTTPVTTGPQSTEITRVEVAPPPPDPTSTPEDVAEVQVATATVPADDSSSAESANANQVAPPGSEPAGQRSLAMLLGRAFDRPTVWPEAVGVALNFEPDSYVVRVFLVNSPENRAIAIPFMPLLLGGPPIVPSAPSILPADTEVLVSASLDYGQIYDGVNKNLTSGDQNSHRRITTSAKEEQSTNPLAAYEKILGVNLKNDLIPVLGNEVALTFPLQAFVGSSRPSPVAEDKNSSDGATKESNKRSPVLVMAIKDRDAVRALIPKVISSVGFKDASLLAQTERKEDTELVSFANVVSYAFVGDFIVLSTDNSAVRHVVDSYLNHQTLSSNPHFRNSTRWEPRQLLGHIYISPAAIDSYGAFSSDPTRTSSLSQKMAELLMSLGPSTEAVTYSLSNEGLGPLHELHVPKKLLVMMAAGMAGGAEQSRDDANEAIAESALRSIVSAEATYQATTGNGKFGSLEDLISNNLITREMTEKYGYRIDLRASETTFESSAVPVEYGKTGKNSFFVDESGVLRMGDHGGGPATVADKPLQ